MKTSKFKPFTFNTINYYIQFQSFIISWLDKCNLNEFNYSFRLNKSNNTNIIDNDQFIEVASVTYDYETLSAEFTLNEYIFEIISDNEINACNDFYTKLERICLHEVSHLLCAEFQFLIDNKCTEKEINIADERFANRIVNLLLPKNNKTEEKTKI